MQSQSSAGFKHHIEKDVVFEFMNARKSEVEKFASKEEFFCVRVQRAWRRRRNRIHLIDLKLSKDCAKFRQDKKISCACCDRGESAGKYAHQIESLQFMHLSKLLFQDHFRQNVHDTGENWNSRFQALLSLEEKTLEDRVYKYGCLSALNNDFIAASTLYAKAIISEYFVHVKDKTILDRSDTIGGQAGGRKYLWRGILFKLADGDSSPWNGNDEAAAKGAGHELKSTAHFFEGDEHHQIRFSLMTLIDYCGFRMTCQAYLPISSRGPNSSLVYGSQDAGSHVLKTNPTFTTHVETMAKRLNLKPHYVGRNRKDMVEICTAVDVEGHWGHDGLYYLLDLQRMFPPEAAAQASHLQNLIPCGVKVKIIIPNVNTINSTLEVEGIVLNVHIKGETVASGGSMSGSSTAYTPPSLLLTDPLDARYDVIIINTSLHPPKVQIMKKIPPKEIVFANITIFHRLLRPEYVLHRGRHLIPLSSEDGKPVDGGNKDSAAVLSRLPSVDPARETAFSRVSSMGLEDQTSGYDNAHFTKTLHDSLLMAAHLESQPHRYMPGDFMASPLHAKDERELVPIPLSSDGLSSFSQYDNNALVHNGEISRATERLLHEVIPEVAIVLGRHFVSHAIDKAATVTGRGPATRKINGVSDAGLLKGSALTQFLHRTGVNMRHMGLLRQCVRTAATSSSVPGTTVDKAFGTGTKATKASKALDELPAGSLFARFEAYKDDVREIHPARGVGPNSAAVSPTLIKKGIQDLENECLLQIVSRTCKNILRQFQRKWMRSEQSTSEEGMKILFAQFFNLMIGSHTNSAAFWREHVLPGIYQRFGYISLLSSLERSDLLGFVRQIPWFMKNLLRKVAGSLAIIVHATTLDKFYSSKKASTFQFFPIDIQKLEARVKSLPIIDEINARYLAEMAALRDKSKFADGSIARLAAMSMSHYARSFQITPGSLSNWKKYEALQQQSLDPSDLNGAPAAAAVTTGGGIQAVSEEFKSDFDSFNLNIDVESEYASRMRSTVVSSNSNSSGILSCCQS